MRQDRLLRRMVRERFVVTLKSGETFDGLLNDQDQQHVTFVAAFAVTETERVSVDGELWLARDTVAYMQRPDAR